MTRSIPTCRDLLAEEWLRRQSSNPRYSLRAFARTLGLSPSFVSMVLSGKRRINASRVGPVATRLGWPKRQRRMFELTNAYELAPLAERPRILGEIDDLEGTSDVSIVKADVFRAISIWYHAAICALVGVDDFDSDPVWIAKRLGILPLEADLAVSRLVRVGLLRWKDGKLEKASPLFSTGDVPSQAIRGFHSHILAKAAVALEQQPMADRDIAGITMAIDREKVAEAREKIIEFSRNLRQQLTRGSKNAVYQLSVAFFRLDIDHRKSK